MLPLAALLALGLFSFLPHWQANAAASHAAPIVDSAAPPGPRRPASIERPASIGQRVVDRRAPGPAIDPYVRPEFAAEMRALQPTIVAAAHRHNRPELSHMSDH